MTVVLAPIWWLPDLAGSASVLLVRRTGSRTCTFGNWTHNAHAALSAGELSNVAVPDTQPSRGAPLNNAIVRACGTVMYGCLGFAPVRCYAEWVSP